MRTKVLLGIVFLSGFALNSFMAGGVPGVSADCPGEPGVVCGNGDVNGDGLLDISDVVYLARYLFMEDREIVPLDCSSGGALLATGQTRCYSGVDPYEEIDCGSEAFPGQDAFYQNGCPMEGRFKENGDGTITDACTGLIWEQATTPVGYTWTEALQYCEDLDLAGHDDWRLPNVRELQSIVDYGRFNPAIYPRFGVLPSYYWSSSSFVFDPMLAWYVRFEDGSVLLRSKFIQHFVCAVRGGL